MQFFARATAVLAFAASAIAQTSGFDGVVHPSSGEVVNAGEEFTITWDAPQNPKFANKVVTIALIGGLSQNLQFPIQTIATGVSNAALSYKWNVPASLGADAVYGLTITAEDGSGVFQYSPPFTINGPAKAASKPASKPASKSAAVSNNEKPSYGNPGAKTVTLGNVPATTVVPSFETKTVPSNTTVPTTFVPVPVVKVPVANNGTVHLTSPAGTGSGSGSGAGAAATPIATPVAGSAGRVSVSFAVIGGLAMAVLAL